jgi:hypothetical protein
MSATDSSLPGSPRSTDSMSDLPPESGQGQLSSALLSDGEVEDGLILYGDDVSQPQAENWDSSVYGAEDEVDPLSGEESDFKRTRGPIIHRENKYLGPASTWRYWTRHERQESTAIETTRARDLSIHLFNAYALKRRGAGVETTAEQEDPDDLRAKAAAASASSFIPPSRWVAWPVPANEVPRTDPSVFKDEWAFKMESDYRPSAELEECLLAEMLKSAKNRFEGRESEANRAKGRGKSKRETPKGSDVDQTTGDEEYEKSDIEMDTEVEFRPVVSADDEASKQILLPAARHMLSRLDSLLLSLHYAREAYAVTEERSGAETATDTDAESVVATRSSPKKRRMRSVGRAQSRGRKRTRPSPTVRAPPRDSESGSEYEGSNGSSSESSSGSEQPRREERIGRRQTISGTDRKGRLGLRGWSDIVGIASITSWPQPAVMRTVQRCAALFGEDMFFRTFNDEETLGSEKGTKDLLSDAGSSEEIRTELRPISQRRKSRSAQGTGSGPTVSSETVFCPVEGCVRQKKGFSRTWNLNLHLKRVHSISKTLVGTVSVPKKDEVEVR